MVALAICARHHERLGGVAVSRAPRARCVSGIGPRIHRTHLVGAGDVNRAEKARRTLHAAMCSVCVCCIRNKNSIQKGACVETVSGVTLALSDIAHSKGGMSRVAGARSAGTAAGISLPFAVWTLFTLAAISRGECSRKTVRAC